MKEDLWRLIAVLLSSLLLGLVIGQVLLCLFLGLAAYVYWQYHSMKQLLNWLRKRSEIPPPGHAGLADEIARDFDYQRSRHKKRKKKLSGYLKRFQQAVGALPDAVVVLGENNEIEWANKKARKYIGIRWPQDANQRISNLVRYPKLVAFLSNEAGKQEESHLQILSPVNPELRIEIRITPYGHNQRLLVARNITRIHRANQMRSDFIANASHELRTPLTVVSGYLETFSEDGDVDPAVWYDQVRRMRKQTDRMQKLIDDLLKLASLESEINTGTHDVLNIAQMIEGIGREARDLSDDMEHRINISTNRGLWLKGHYKELHSAFSNIVFNAVKYSPVNAEIEISWYQDDNGVHFEVRDHGEGIAAEHLPRLTERFYRVDDSRSREKGGTGLGLAIVKHVLVRHGGNLDIQSEPGKGSTFRCNFPSELAVIKSTDNTVSYANV